MSGTPVVLIENADIYQEKNLVLSDISFSLAKGEFVYLVGKTGSGKSSFLKTLYAEISLTTGTGIVAGYDLRKIRRRQIPYLRRKLGIVFQDFQLLTDRSVNDNLRFVMRATGWKDRKKIQEQIDALLLMTGLEGKGNKMPHQLSGGEQQRVAIARALVNNAELILADEPTGNLDPETSAEIINLLFSISKAGTAVVMATHDYTIMERFQMRTVKCEDRKLQDIKPVGFFNPMSPLS